jgi:hypothetical protein
MSLLSAFTLLHVVLSLIGIAAGLVALSGFLASKRLEGWNVIFLASTIATSVTGFLFPFHGITPGIVLGVLSLIVLSFAVMARSRAWRKTYVISATAALYFNCFVLVVQSFQKIAPLRELAPTQSEPPFAITQGVVLVAFVILGTLAVKRFRPETAAIRAKGAGA